MDEYTNKKIDPETFDILYCVFYIMLIMIIKMLMNLDVPNKVEEMNVILKNNFRI